MEKNTTTILTTTRSGNRYLFDRKKNSILLCNPILYHFTKLYAGGVDIRSWLNGLDNFPVKLDGHGDVSRHELEYYYKKFLFLQDSGYFSEPQDESFENGMITAEMVEYSLANCRQVTFESTQRCSLACQYCGCGDLYNLFGERKENDLDIEKAKSLLSYMTGYWNSPSNSSYGKIIYISFYGGEPLLNFTFVEEIVQYTKKLELRHGHVQFSMTTNALLLEKYMDFLVENQFNLLISLDGNEENNGFRVFKNGKPAFKEIKKNIEALKSAYPDYFRDKVNFNAVLHNKNSVAQIHSFFSQNYEKAARIGELKSTGVKQSRQEEFKDMFTSVYESLNADDADSARIEREMFVKLPGIQQLSTFLQQYGGNVFEDYRHLWEYGDYKKEVPTGTCLPFSKKIFVSSEGKLLPCETISHQFHLGQITADGVELDFAEIAKTYNDYFQKISKLCNHCYSKNSCGACIFNLFVHGDSRPPVCRLYTDAGAFSRYLGGCLDSFEKKPDYYTRILTEVTVD
jgi:uncharacterized protein